MSTISIPDHVTTIANGAFASCNNLSSIIIPKSVEEIGSSAFSNCSSLIVFYGGNASDWAEITISNNNGYLIDATRYYYSETEPASAGKWWHYVNGTPTVWTNN